MPKATTIKEISETAKRELAALTGFSSPSAIGIQREDKDWVVSIEILEKERIPDTSDVLGLYAVKMDANGNLVGYERIGHRRRTQIEEAS